MSALQDPLTEYDDLGVIIDSLMEENDHLRNHLERILTVLAEQTANVRPVAQIDETNDGPNRDASDYSATLEKQTPDDRRDHARRPFDTSAPNLTATQDVQLWVATNDEQPREAANTSTTDHHAEFQRIAMADLERRLRNQEETVQDLMKLTRSLLQPS